MFIRRNIILILVLLCILATGCGDSPESGMVRAQHFADARDFRSAIIELKGILQNKPGDLRARWLLGSVYLELEEGASAEKELVAAKGLGLAEDSVLPLLARSLLLQQKDDDVLALAPTMPLSASSEAELDAIKGLAYLRKGDQDKASVKIGEAGSKAPGSSQVLISRAVLLIAQHEFDEAHQVLEVLIKDHPTVGMGWSLLGDVYVKNGSFVEAVKAYAEVLKYRLNSISDQIKRGSARLAQNDVKGAESDADLLLRRQVKTPQALYYIGLVKYRLEKYAEASEALETSYSESQEHIPTSFLLALVELKLGNQARALALAEGVVASAPNFLPGRKLLGAIYVRMHNGERAEEIIRPVVHARPNDLGAKQILASSLILNGRPDEAAMLLEEIVLHRKGQPLDQLRFGLAMLSAGRNEEGLSALSDAVRLSPSDKSVNVAAVISLISTGRQGDALTVAERYADLEGQNPFAWSLLGIARLANDREESAKEAFERALALSPGYEIASESMSSLSLKAGDFAKAKEFLELGLDRNPDSANLLYRLATVELKRQDLSAAETLLQQSLAASPNFLPPRIALGGLMVSRGQSEKAISLLSSQAYDQVIDILKIRSEAYFGLGRFVDAEENLKKLAEEEPDSLPTHFALARVHAELGKRRELEKDLEQLMRLAPEDPFAALAKIRLLIIDGRLKEADYLLENIGLSPSNKDVMNTRYAIEVAKGNDAGAEEVANKAFEVYPSGEAVRRLADALVKSGQLAAATSKLEDWVAQHPNDTSSIIALAGLYKNSGGAEKSIELLQAVAEMQPTNWALFNNLAWMTRESTPGIALKYAVKAYDLAPEVVAVLDTYAEVLIRNSKKQEAMAIIDKLAEISGDSAGANSRREELMRLSAHSEGGR